MGIMTEEARRELTEENLTCEKVLRSIIANLNRQQKLVTSGKQYGALTIQGVAPTPVCYSRVRARCSCGRTTTAHILAITSGRISACHVCEPRVKPRFGRPKQRARRRKVRHGRLEPSLFNHRWLID
jgi:hypothetical protein